MSKPPVCTRSSSVIAVACLSPNQIGAYLAEAGVYSNDEIKKAVGRIVAGYRNACLEGSDRLDQPMARGSVWPLPGNLMGLLDINPHPHDVEGHAVAGFGAPDAMPTPVVRAPETDGLSSKPAVTTGLTTMQMAEKAITAQVDDGLWDKDRRRDVEAAVKLFVAANGDVPFAAWEQRHLAAVKALFPRLPVRYGFAKKDPVTGEDSQESIEEALVRGDALRRQWRENPARAEDEKLALVGLGPVTCNKHMTWLSALVTYAQGAGDPAPKALNFSLVRAKGRAKKSGGAGPAKKNAALPAWDTADLQRLFTAPIWTGCAGLWNRFDPGGEIIHDAWYWAPLILTLHGCRSDEGCGLALDDIFDNVSVPYFRVRPNGFRRIKTAASNRSVPINPRLIELGFLDYVPAMRALGHEALFPELWNEKLGFDHVFYDKIFEPLRATMFPAGTSRKRGRKDCDVRSIRSRCITHLRDIGAPKDLRQAIVGHEVGDVTSDVYEDDADPGLLLPWVTRLSKLLPPIERRPLNLRPREWQKFGAPRGRPRKTAP